MKDEVTVAAAIVYKLAKGKILWFLIKESDDNGWEIPRTNARRGESSVRAVIRMMAEQGGMEAKVLEEAGRAGGAVKVKERLMTQRTYYYLMEARESGEVLGFTETEWFDYGQATRKLTSKREQGMLREASKILKVLQKKAQKIAKAAEISENI